MKSVMRIACWLIDVAWVLTLIVLATSVIGLVPICICWMGGGHFVRDPQ